jgi:hypothetical protein
MAYGIAHHFPEGTKEQYATLAEGVEGGFKRPPQEQIFEVDTRLP